jgi:hypothetical protein
LRLRNAFLKLVAASGGLIVAILVLEMGVRLLKPQPAVRYRYSRHHFYEPIPGARFVYRRSEFAIPVEYNQFGMRDRERQLAKPAGTVRLALVGDSQTEAKEVSFDSTFGQILERRLQEGRPGHRIEVLNFGVSGFGTLASAARFAALGSRFDPDVVLYLFNSNDPEDNCGKDRQLGVVHDGRLELRLLPPANLRRRVLDVVKHHSQLYAYVRLTVPFIRLPGRRAAGGDDAAPGAVPIAGECWELTRLALALLRDRAAACGATLVVAQAGAPSEDRTRSLQAICSELGLPLHDLMPALRRMPGPLHFRDDGHWRGTSHVVAAEDLVGFLTPFVDDAGAQSAPSTLGAATSAPGR